MKRMRLLTKILLILIVILAAVGVFCAYRLFGGSLNQGTVNADEALTAEEQELAEKRAAAEADEDEDTDTVQYIPTGTGEDYDGVIRDADDAMEALTAIQSRLGIADAAEEYRVSDEIETTNLDIYTMQQYYENIPVYGYSLQMSVSRTGELRSVSGSYGDVQGIETDIDIDTSEAGELAKDYMKSTYGSGDDTYSIENSGKIIFFIDGEPVVGYRISITTNSTDIEVRALFIDGQTGEILSDQDMALTDMITGDLKGQKQTQTTDYLQLSDTSWQLKDSDRNITACRTTLQNLDLDNLYAAGTDIVEWDDSGSPDESAVDALANLQKVYDYYLDTFGRYGTENDPNTEITAVVNVNEVTAAGDTDVFLNNAAMYGTRKMIIGQKTDGSATYAADLDVMGHEFNHGVVNGSSTLLLGSYSFSSQRSIQYAIGEGLADLFGELAEDYTDDGKYNGSCSWDNAVRSLKSPSSEMILDDDDFAEGTTDCHDGASLVTWPAYLMTTGDGDSSKAISDTETLGILWYNVIQQTNSQTDFIRLRYLTETNALILWADQTLTDGQLEGVLDAFDQVGIDHSYNYAWTKSCTLKVYDQNNELYDHYHLLITEMGEEILSADVTETTFDLNLNAGIYTVVLTDLENEDLTETFTLIINDNSDKSKNEEYAEEGEVFTSFGSNPRDVVLLLDVTGSMDGTPIEQVKKSAVSFIDTVLTESPATRITLVTYNENPSVLIESSNRKEDLTAAVQGISANGSTNIQSALAEAYDLIKNKNSDTKMVILMSDGLPTDGDTDGGSYNPPILTNASTIKNDDILLYTLGFFHSLTGDELTEASQLMTDIASAGYYYEVTDADSVQFVFDDIAQQVSGEQYIYIRIECPVNVTVTADGETLSSASGDQNLRTSFGTLSFDDDNETKILRLKEDGNYEICINGTGTGTMDYSISFADEEGNYSDVRTFTDIPVTETMLAVTGTEQSEKTVLSVDEDGDGIFELVYKGTSNTPARQTGGYRRILIPAVIILIAVLWLIQKLRTAFRRKKENLYCASCGRKLKSSAKFCPQCGAVREIKPLFSSGKASPQRLSGGGLIAHLTAIGIIAVLIFGVVRVYRMPATSVYRQIVSRNYTAAEKIYENHVEDHMLAEKYLSALLDYHIDRMEDAYEDGDVDSAYVVSGCQAISGLHLDTVSDRAADSAKSFENRTTDTENE